MDVLSYGYYKPERPDKPEDYFPALEQNFERLNGHNHNGVNSAKLTSSAIESVAQTVAATWEDLGNGNFRQLVNCATGANIDDMTPNFFLLSGPQILLSYERITATSFYLYINDNTQAVKVKYTS